MSDYGPVSDKPCGKCGVVPRLDVEYDICSMCGGSGDDEIGNPCVFCEHGEATIEDVVCGCDENGEDYEVTE